MSGDAWLNILADHLHPVPSPYASDYAAWTREVRGGFVWSKQREIAQALTEHRKVMVPSCHASGKSFNAANIAAWWIDTHPVGQAFVLSTAPTYQQVHSILWEELRQAHRQAKLDGQVSLSDDWKIGRREVGLGRKPSDHDEHGFQGFHRLYLLVLVDEACGIPLQLWHAIDSVATGADNRILAFGNPDDSSSRFAELEDDPTWHVVRISAFDTPNFTGEPVPKVVSDNLISVAWVEEKKEEWGEDSPIYRSKVLGLFSEDSTDGVIPGSLLAKARVGRDYVNLEHETRGQGVQLGVDLGAGGDRSVFALREGPRCRIVGEDRQPDTMRTARKAAELIVEHEVDVAAFDVIGIGRGIFDRVVEMQREGMPGLEHVRLQGVNNAERPDDPERYANVRAESWFQLRGRLLREAVDLADLPDDAAQELLDPRYFTNSRGRLQLEPKEDTVARLGRSPDSADAVVLAFYHRSASDGETLDSRPDGGATIYRRGDIVKKGKRYIDKEPRR